MRRPPYPFPALAATAVALEVTLTADETTLEPWRGGELPFECDR